MINKTKFTKNLLFILITILSFGYFLFVAVLFQKVLESCLTLFLSSKEVFDLESLSLIFSNSKSIYSIFGAVLVIFMILRIVKAFIRTVLGLYKTHRFLKSFSKTERNGYYIIHTAEIFAFTSGIFEPKIYLSSGLINSVNKKELKVILSHEKEHQRSLDPLRSAFMKFLRNSLPQIPFMRNIFESYELLTEVSADQGSQKNLENNKSAVSALLKILNRSELNFVSSFNNQPSRIEVLIGKKKLKLLNYVFIAFMLMLPFISLPFFTSKALAFDSCNGIESCFIETSSNSQLMNSEIEEYCELQMRSNI